MSKGTAACGLLLLLVLSLLAACGGPDEKKMKFFDKGKALYEQGEYVKARMKFKNAVQIDPEFANGQYYLGLTAQEERDFRKAFGYFTKAAELDPNLLDAQVEIGKYLLAAGRRKDALHKADLALASKPDHQKALLLKSAVLIANNNTDDAVALLKGLLARNVKEPQVYQMLASAYFIKDNPAKAEEIYLDGIAANQTDTALLLALTKFYQNAQKPHAAEETLLRAIEIEPANVLYKLQLADVYWEEKRVDDAIEIVDGALKTGKEAPDTYRLAAQFYSNKKRLDKVQQTLEGGIEQDPQNIELRIMLGKHFLAQNRPLRALDTLQACLESSSENKSTYRADVKNTLAAAHLVLHNEKEAAALIEDVLDADPHSAAGHYNRGKLYLLKGDGVGAVSEFGVVVSDRPQNIHGYLALAAACELNNQPEPAIDTLKNALKVNPNAKDVLQSLARLYVLTEDYFDAGELLRKIVAIYPEDNEARAELGDFLLARGDTEGAVKQYEILKLESPDKSIGYLKLGRLYARSGKLERALSEIKEGYRRNPRAEFLAPMIQILVRLQKPDEAIAVCRNHIRAYPQDPLPHNLLGWVYLNQKAYQPAEDALEEAIRIRPDWPAPHANLARLYLAQGKQQEAIQKFEASLAAHPKAPQAYLSLCKIYEGAGDYRKAIGVYERALEYMPDFWVAANNLAFLLSEQSTGSQDLERAMELAQKAYRLQPGHPLVADTLAWVYYNMSNNIQARILLEEALTKLPDDPSLNYHLAMALYRDGLLKEARLRLEKALESDGEFIGRSRAEKTLAEMSKNGEVTKVGSELK